MSNIPIYVTHSITTCFTGRNTIPRTEPFIFPLPPFCLCLRHGSFYRPPSPTVFPEIRKSRLIVYSCLHRLFRSTISIVKWNFLPPEPYSSLNTPLLNFVSYDILVPTWPLHLQRSRNHLSGLRYSCLICLLVKRLDEYVFFFIKVDSHESPPKLYLL